MGPLLIYRIEWIWIGPKNTQRKGLNQSVEHDRQYFPDCRGTSIKISYLSNLEREPQVGKSRNCTGHSLR